MIAPETGSTIAALADADLVVAFPDEVVTRCLARDIDLPGAVGTLVLLTLDNGHDHTRPNTLGPAGLLALESQLDIALVRNDVVAVGVTGKPYVFAAGADLGGAAAIRERDRALAIARLGHRVLGKLGSAGIPTFTFWNGVTLGGGVEIGLNSHYRTISSDVTMLALPECSIGLVPGWGGCYLLPRLIGPEAAVKIIIENPLARNTMLTAPEVLALGIADAMFDPADFLEQSLVWAAEIVSGDRQVNRADHCADSDRGTWSAAVARGRAVADARVHGAAPAPYRALELIAATRDRSPRVAFAAEDEVLADVIMTDEFHASVYAFDLVQRRAKRPAGAPDPLLAREISKVGVIGAGLMASQLALLFARRLEVPIAMTDVDQERVDRGLGLVRDQVAVLRAKGRLSDDKANRLIATITGQVGFADFADADLVVEAVFEDLATKQHVLSDIEQVVQPACVLATNTSSLSVTTMGSQLVHPERLIGMHFFNPVAVMPLLEVVRAPATDDATTATALAVGKALRKTCIVVADAPAFVVNRLLARFLGEVNNAVDDGTPIDVADHSLDPLGLPMTPFELLDLTGPAVSLHVAETMHAAFPERYAISSTLRRMVDNGITKVWIDGGNGRTVNPAVVALQPSDGHPWTAERVRNHAVAAIADELRRMLDDEVVGDVGDVDLAMILGAGWPFHLGGIAPYLDRSGVAEAVTGRRFLADGAASARTTESSAPPQTRVPGAAYESVGGSLTSRGLTIQLSAAEVPDDPAPGHGRELSVRFPMPLPVGQIALFTGRTLPIPAAMFTAVLAGFGAEVPVTIRGVKVISAADGTATLELAGDVDYQAAGLHYANDQVTCTATVSVS